MRVLQITTNGCLADIRVKSAGRPAVIQTLAEFAPSRTDPPRFVCSFVSRSFRHVRELRSRWSAHEPITCSLGNSSTLRGGSIPDTKMWRELAPAPSAVFACCFSLRVVVSDTTRSECVREREEPSNVARPPAPRLQTPLFDWRSPGCETSERASCLTGLLVLATQLPKLRPRVTSRE